MSRPRSPNGLFSRAEVLAMHIPYWEGISLQQLADESLLGISPATIRYYFLRENLPIRERISKGNSAQLANPPASPKQIGPNIYRSEFFDPTPASRATAGR